MGLWPQFRSPLMWDVFAVSTYATVSLLFWFVGLVPDLATLRDRSQSPVGRDRLRHAGDGLARLGAALAPVRHGLSASGGAGDAAGRLGAHGRQLRLRRRDRARLAHHDLPALLRRRRDLFGLRDGVDAGDSDSRGLRARRLHHDAPPREHGEGDAGDRVDRRLRLRDRGLHRLVQRQRLRGIHDLEPDDRSVSHALLGAAVLQRRSRRRCCGSSGCASTPPGSSSSR